MHLTHQPAAGRLCIRINDGGSMVIGLMHLPAAMEIIEGAAYVLQMLDGAVSLGGRLDEGLPVELVDAGVTHLMTSPVWRDSTDPSVLIVRFFEAFPETNSWTMFGATRHRLPVELDGSGHGWLDVASGGITAISAPVDARGRAIGQLLSSCAIWPHLDGKRYSLPQLAIPTRHRYLQRSHLIARLGAGEITREEYEAALRASPELLALQGPSVDAQYARFLHLLHMECLLGLDAPRTAGDIESRELHMDHIIRNKVAASMPGEERWGRALLRRR